MPHCVEGEEVVFADPVRFPEELETGFEDPGFGVLEGDPHAEHRASVMVVEIYTFGDFPTGDAEQDGAAAVAASGAVSFECQGSFLGIRRFDKDEFVFPNFIKDFHALPHADDGLHVEVRREEDNEAVWRDFREFCQQGTVVADDAGFVADLEAGGNGRLIGAAGDDHGEEGVAGEGHAVGFLDDGGEAEHFGVHF